MSFFWGCFPSVTERNFPPQLELVSPFSGQVYNEGEIIAVEVVIRDELLLNGGVSVSWSSNLNGLLHERIPNSDGFVTLSSVSLTPGQHQTTIRAEDAEGLSVELPLDIFVNASPSSPQITILPENPTTEDTLTVQAHGSLDPEGEPVVLEYEWLQNNSPFTPESDSPDEISSDYTSKGQSWMVRVLATDGMAYSESVTASVIIQGTSPEISDIEISPQMVNSNDLLTCSATGEDADSDEVLFEYYWRVVSNGSLQDVIYDGSTFQLTPEEVKPNDKPTCFVRAFDEDGESNATHFVNIENRSPEVDTILIYPATGVRPGTQLTCDFTATDPDLQSISESYKWYREDPSGSLSLLSLEATLDVSTENANKDDIMRCEVTVQDELGMNTTAQSEVTVVNTPPQITEIGLTPQNPSAEDPIECTVLAEDIDGDAYFIQYAWFLDGILQTESSNIFSQSRTNGSSVECTASIYDAEDTGNSMRSSVTVINSPPSISSLNITYDQVPTTNTLLTAEVEATDIDGDSLIVHYDWYVNGILVKTGFGATLDGEDFFDKNDEILAIATADDGQNLSISVPSNSILIENTAPTQPEASLGADFLLTDEDILCTIETESTDEDNDSISYDFQWHVNGVEWTGSTSTTIYSGDSINHALISTDDEWTCMVTASDDSESVASNVEATTIVHCPVEYEYNIVDNFMDLENIQDCWTMGSNSSFDMDTFIPFSNVWTSESEFFQYRANNYFILNPYNGTSSNGVMVSSLDVPHENTITLQEGFSLAGAYLLHNPDVVKINVGYNNAYTFLQWSAPMTGTCTVDLMLTPVSYFYQPYFYRYVSTPVTVHHNETELESVTVEGYNNLQVNIEQEINLVSSDTITVVFHPSNSDYNVDWIQITGGISCQY